jgi:MYXO-CTERM domain-containing protein
MHMRRSVAAALLSALVFSAPAYAQVTNFSTDVATAIDRGLAWLDGQGGFANPSPAGDAAGLVALSLLEKRRSADLRADPTGYANATPADQQRIEQIMAYIMNRAPGAGFYAYRDGADLMAMSVYLRSGGPQQGQALAAIQATFDRVVANQNGAGYWCYNDGSCSDSSTTQLSMAGLAAARAVFSDPNYADGNRLARLNAATALCRQGYSGNAQGGDVDGAERGHGYRVGYAPSYQQTASGLWGQIIGGADLNDGSVQSYLRWLRNHYNYSTIASAPNSWTQSYYYYMWSSAKAYTYIEDSHVQPNPGNLSTHDVGVLAAGDAPAYGSRLVHRDPNTDPRVPAFGGDGAGYYASIHEPARWYYDYAYTILSRQDGAGHFDPGPGNSAWNNWADESYPLLVLERSVGGGCADTDQDRICDVDDNCPALANPDQGDRDHDGVGDICDDCPEAPDPDQADNDHNGLGDACQCIPSPEVCDGIDNDCNGQIDDGNPGANQPCDTGIPGECGHGLTFCANGGLQCAQQVMPADEICDGLDNDCDGQVDDGDPGANQRCNTGMPGLCAAGSTFCADGRLQCQALQMAGDEVCDGIDNDCDGQVDEDLGNGDACDTGMPGACAAGHLACDNGVVDCSADVSASDEVCDGIDNDCDGQVDNFVAGVGEACATGQPGVCREGQNACLGGSLSCQPEEAQGDEICDRLDNDCDGQVDEGLRNACGGCGPVPPEVCNGADDDCNGQVDDNAPCDDGLVCRFGHCVPPCTNNECAGNRVCAEGVCADPCDVMQCPAGQACRDARCVDPCEGMQCPGGQLCQGGSCVDDSCYGTGCPDGQRCVDLVCVPDPCAGVFCNDDEFCRDGACISTCATVSCPFGEACRDGECVADSCADQHCPDGQICTDGQCGPDPCAGIECGLGRACADGLCGHDPCFNVHCPPAEMCRVFDGQPQCEANWPPIDVPVDGGVTGDGGVVRDGGPDADVVALMDAGPIHAVDLGPDHDGGSKQADPVTEGCACDASGGAGAAPWLLALGLLAFRRRRRA